MLAIVKKGADSLDKAWKRLPWLLRAAISGQRWYLGIKGLPALWGTVLSLAWGGAVVGFFGSLPPITQIIWAGGGVLSVLGIAGHVGASFKASTGQVRFMSDKKLADTAHGLLADIEQLHKTVDHNPIVWAAVPQITEAIENDTLRWRAKETLRLSEAIDPSVRRIVDEAMRRRIMDKGLPDRQHLNDGSGKGAAHDCRGTGRTLWTH